VLIDPVGSRVFRGAAVDTASVGTQRHIADLRALDDDGKVVDDITAVSFRFVDTLTMRDLLPTMTGESPQPL
jgi:hypothetical protein